MAILHRDYMRGSLSAAIGPSTTTLTSTEFSKLPVVVGANTLDLTLDPDGLGGEPEHVTVTSHGSSSTSIVVTRGVDAATPGTSTARSHPEDTLWTHGFHASELDAMAFAVQGAVSTNTSQQSQINALGTAHGAFISRAGDTMDAPLNLNYTPSLNAHAAHKRYVDERMYNSGLQPLTPNWLGVSVGNGSTGGWWQRVNNRVFLSCYIEFGSTTSFTAQPQLLLPFDHGVSGSGSPPGSFRLTGLGFDKSTGRFWPLLIRTLSSERISPYSLIVSAGDNIAYKSLSATLPHTWANEDTLSIEFEYETTEPTTAVPFT